MPPATVYTNMANSADVEGGGVFANLKFFVVQRVPSRSHYISLVEINGGRIVKLEAQADYLIADHLRHDAPAGSLSYKFIEETVKQGQIPEDDSPFLAGRRKSAMPVTTAVASSSKKSTRTPFTDDDDKMLYKWVHRAHEQRLATQGNTLYQVLAAHNPRHTFHSWRDRYVKVLSTRPPPGWEAYPDDNLPTFDTPTAEIPSTALPRSTAINTSAPRSASATKSPSKARLYNPFTHEDDQELAAWVTKKGKLGASLNGNAIYKELEERNPRHTYHSWRDRWVRHLSLRDPVDEEQEEGLDDAAPVEDDHISTRQDPSPEPPISRPPVKRPTFRVPPGASASAESFKNTTPRTHVPRTTASTKKAVKSTPAAAAPPPSAAREQLVAAAAPLPTASTSRPAVTPKNQANTPMARTGNLSSPVMSQQPQPQQALAQASCPPIRHRAIQTDLGTQFHDDSTFTEKDFKDLLSVAFDIQSVRVGRYQESWITWANHNKSHTAVEWRSFYEKRVLPVALQREDDLEHLKEQGDIGWVEFWENQGQPITTLPYLEQNTTSETRPAPPKAIGAKGESLPHASETQSTEQDQEMEDTVNHSAKRKQQISVNLAEEQPTPKLRRTATPPSAPSKILTPSHTVQQPEDDDMVSISSKRTPTPSYHSDEEGEISEDQAAEQLRREMAENKDSRHQLTRANLARIQAENGLPDEHRGVDIEEDDKDDDQADFAKYLASMLPPGMADKSVETVETNERRNEQDEEDEDDEDTVMNNYQHEGEHEIDPNLDDPCYYSSAEFQANNPNIRLDAPTTQPWEISSAPSQSQPQPQRLSTQAIYEAETQQFDIDVPLPPPEFAEETQSYAAAQSDSQILSTEEFWPWIDAQTAAGHAEEDVIAALRQTSFNPKLASIVLKAEGEVDIPGVWTAEEDRIVEGSDANAIRRLEAKHGKGSVSNRWQFLDDWRKDEEIAKNGGGEEL
ncbi:uncharacterized protein M437DRAFT_52189 [Aureobasidium melanogenum CBS 110374]|uniref:DNA-binding protein RAP1 n=1 Tax=Aureobasidium melanogenum (strain CBS 110374) TaxID=1043003 RepID=A0A074VLD7_AURM1|nr:uncharacterized protein M437DRAFT_52189 [Aureobasidium melanogenum CBS 110374]KEQ61348.1 hypothetical protein M437DRAFT_52189 [Aureobasidium melanogenum CBS 110374]